jgi:hypothetical protein
MARFLSVFLCTILFSLPLSADSQKVLETLENLRKPKQEGAAETFVLSEEDVNDWIKMIMSEKKEYGIEELSVDFLGNNKLSSTTTIDMDKVTLENLSADVFKSILSGKQKINVTGSLIVYKPYAEFEVEKAEINEIEVPSWLIQSVFSYVSTHQEPKIDLSERFFLPFGITNVEISEDSVKITR